MTHPPYGQPPAHPGAPQAPGPLPVAPDAPLTDRAGADGPGNGHRPGDGYAVGGGYAAGGAHARHRARPTSPGRPPRRRRPRRRRPARSSGRCARRWPRPSSARTPPSPAWSSPCCAAGTCCSRACRAWPRPSWCGPWPRPGPGHQAGAVHPRPHARRRHRLARLRRAHRGVLLPRGPGVHQPPARRRDQPHPAQDPGRRCSRPWRSGRSPSTARPRPLPDPFMVIATQNPVEYEGTYPLPEAQLDRFLLKLVAAAARARRGDRGAAPPRRRLRPPRPRRRRRAPGGRRRGPRRRPRRGRRACRSARGARLRRRPRARHPHVAVALPRASPRAGRRRCSPPPAAWAWLSGRDYVTPDDVKALAHPTLRHRVQLRAEAELEGVTAETVLAGVLAAVPVPR